MSQIEIFSQADGEENCEIDDGSFEDGPVSSLQIDEALTQPRESSLIDEASSFLQIEEPHTRSCESSVHDDVASFVYIEEAHTQSYESSVDDGVASVDTFESEEDVVPPIIDTVYNVDDIPLIEIGAFDEPGKEPDFEILCDEEKSVCRDCVVSFQRSNEMDVPVLVDEERRVLRRSSAKRKQSLWTKLSSK